MFMILSDGRKYEVVQVPEGANPDYIIVEKYPGWIFVDDASTRTEADSKNDRDHILRKTDSW